MKIRFNIDASEKGKAHLDREDSKITAFPPKEHILRGEIEIDLTPEELAASVAMAPSNLGAEDARKAFGMKLAQLWAKVAPK